MRKVLSSKWKLKDKMVSGFSGSVRVLTRLPTRSVHLFTFPEICSHHVFLSSFTIGSKQVLLHWAYLPFNTLRTGDADLRFYITTVQDG